MKKTILTTVVALITPVILIAENAVELNIKMDVQNLAKYDDGLKEKWDAALGTFQFEVLNSSSIRNVDIHMDVIDEILANRHESEVTYIPYTYNSDIRIKILPQSQITTNFEPLPLMVRVNSFE